MALAKRVYECSSREFALGKDWGLSDQMRRAAISIASNIAEGNDRAGDRDSCRFFYMSKSSAAELATQTQLAADVGLLEATLAAGMIDECDQICAMLHALIAARLRSVPSGAWRPEPGA